MGQHQRFEEAVPSAVPVAATPSSMSAAGRLNLHATIQTAYDKEADQCYLFDLALRCVWRSDGRSTDDSRTYQPTRDVVP
jgi:hypothetical protein